MKNFGFDSNFIEKLKQNNDIVSVISKYLTLTKKGSQFWACCPFHYEKTPSFAINEHEQYYHCFGCGETGDVISFVRKYENVDFVKAVEILANNAGMEIPEMVISENVAKAKRSKDKTLEINKAAAKFFVGCLYSKAGEKAYEYLTNRNITKQSLLKFGIGYSPDWTSLVSHLKQAGFSDEELLESGICEQKNGRMYDPFAERIIFPILNSFGDVLGFSGRTMSKEKNIAKYRNTKETIVFEKGKSIFGINLVKKYKQENELSKIIIAEGQIDVIKIHQAGFPYAVACMGTALTPNHAKELKRFCDKVIVCFDGDSAGQKATLRSLNILCEAGLNVGVVTLPDGKDPDEFITEFGKEKFEELLSFAKPVVDFQIYTLSKKYNLSNNFEKTKFVNESLEILKNQPSLIDSEIYLKTLHDLTGVSMDTLRQNLNIKPTKQNSSLTNKNLDSENAFVKAEKFTLASMLFKKEFAFIPTDEFFYFKNPSFTTLFEEIKKGIKVGDVFDLFNLEEEKGINDIVSYSFEDGTSKQYFLDSVNYIIKQNIQAQIDQLQKVVKDGTSQEKLDAIKQIQQLTKKLLNKNGDN